MSRTRQHQRLVWHNCLEMKAIQSKAKGLCVVATLLAKANGVGFGYGNYFGGELGGEA